MHTRLWKICCLSAGLLAQLPLAGWAQDTTPPKQISYDELAALGEAIDARELLKDNVFLFEESATKIQAQAQALPGANIVFSVGVTRVTPHEVLLYVPDAGDTRLALQHEWLPQFGNLRSVAYCGSLSTRIANILSKPMALRIGAQIDIEMAKKLRKGDVLVLAGRLETLHLLLDNVFQPRAIAVVSQIQTRSVNSAEASKEYFFR